MMQKMKIYIILALLFFCSVSLTAQLLRCGLPNFYPRLTTDYRTFVDTCNNNFYLFKRIHYSVTVPKWYYQGKVISATKPIDLVQNGVNSAIILITFTDAIWYNTTDNKYYKYYYNVADWLIDGDGSGVALDIRPLNNTFTGTNDFTGQTTTNGFTANGTATKEAAKVAGVQSNKIEIVTANKTLDGTSNTLHVRPSAANIELTLPAASSFNNGWFYIIKKDNAATFLLIVKDNAGTTLQSIYTEGVSIEIESNGTSWRVRQK